jgi:GGDEF domain-containing protein
MSIEYRNNDAVLTICQNNKAASVTICEINHPASELLGFGSYELADKPLSAILPQRIADLLNEYIDFANDTNDVGSVLSKVQSFSIMGKNGTEHAYRIKIYRIESSGGNSFFSIVLHDAPVMRRNEALRKIIKDNFKGHESLDPDTALPDRISLVKDIEVMKHHINNSDMLSCLAVMQIDGYDKLLAQHGREVCNEMAKYMVSVAKRSLRPDDVIGMVSDGRIGILLVDINNGSERLVLNRLRWQVASNPYVGENGRPIALTVSIAFCGISGRGKETDQIDKCEAALDKLHNDVTNTLLDTSI